MVHAKGMVGQRLGTMRLSKIQPKPWRWCMQVSSMRCRQPGLSPLFPSTHRVLPLVHYPSLSCHLHWFCRRGTKGPELGSGTGGLKLDGHLCQYAGLLTEVKKWGRGWCM
jgi:hypothetical protein